MKREISDIAKLMLHFSLILIAILLIIAVRKFLLNSSLNKKLFAKNKSFAVTCAYAHIKKILLLYEIKTEYGQSETEFIEAIIKEVLTKDEDSLKKALSIAQKARFSKNAITQEERDFCVKLAIKISNDYYNSLSLVGKLGYKCFYPEIQK